MGCICDKEEELTLPVEPEFEPSNTSQPSYKWVKCYSGSSFPENAVRGGEDIDGTTIYVGRALHCGDTIPAKVIPEKCVAYVCHAGEEHAKSDYEVLCETTFKWRHGSHGSVPVGAVVGGHTADGEVLYIGRVHHNGAITIGKIHPGHGCLYIPFDSTEMSFTDYEVLVYN